ncbi:MAG TPA: alpha/beta hydrolase-fold protein [Kofleriaceae bacterium]|nr:alpha/beta hydrolase-fold protein [Kofleriaceae bacterium]
MGSPSRGDGVPDLAGAPAAHVIVHYPTGFGHRITIRGNGAGLSWDLGHDATWTEGDRWVLDVLPKHTIEWKPLFDDATWAVGPNFALAPGQTLDVWPTFFHGHGRLEDRPDLDAAHDVVVYLPPSYDENSTESYPVVYMHDGQNLFDDAQAFGGISWDVAGALDRGAADATIRDAIVVAIANTAARIAEYTPIADPSYGGGGADGYLHLVADQIKPRIDHDYRTLAGREHTAIMGSSLGGLVSVYAGVTRPDVFGLVGALSPSTWWDGTWIIPRVASEPTDPVRVYVDSGDSGDSQDGRADTATLAQAYRTRGATLDYVVQAGAQHNEYYWRQRVPGALAFLLGPRYTGTR